MLIARPSILAWLALATCACVIDWDAYEPLTTSNGGGGPGGGSGGVASGGDGPGGSGGNPTMGGGGSGGETTGGGGSGGSPVCGTFAVLTDDFSDGVLTDHYWSTEGPGATVSETGGERIFELANNTQSWSGATSKRAYDLRDSRAFIEVTQMADTSTDAEAFFTINYGGGNYVSVSQRLGQLRASRALSNQWMQVAAFDYDPVEHRWWSIREQGGTIYWETSPDGSDWNAFASMDVSALFPVDLVFFEFGAATWGNEVNPGEVHFDNLDGGTPTGVGWCPVSDLTDDFEDGERARIWAASYEDANCVLAEEGGKLTVSIDGGVATDCAYFTAKGFDLTGRELAIETGSFASALPSEYAFLRAERDFSNGIVIVYSGDQIQFQTEFAGSTQTHASFAYSETDDRWWRIREDAGFIYFETSSDGVAWDARYDLPAPFQVSDLAVVIGAGVGLVESTGSVVEFDNLNLPP